MRFRLGLRFDDVPRNVGGIAFVDAELWRIGGHHNRRFRNRWFRVAAAQTRDERDAEEGNPKPDRKPLDGFGFCGLTFGRRLVIVKKWAGLTTQVCVPVCMDDATLPFGILEVKTLR